MILWPTGRLDRQVPWTAERTRLLEGAVLHFGRPVQVVFLVYLLFWSFFVGSALISACGVTAHAL